MKSQRDAERLNPNLRQHPRMSDTNQFHGSVQIDVPNSGRAAVVWVPAFDVVHEVTDFKSMLHGKEVSLKIVPQSECEGTLDSSRLRPPCDGQSVSACDCLKHLNSPCNNSDLGEFPTQLTIEKKMGDNASAGVVVTRPLQKSKRRLQNGEMFCRPQSRRDLSLVDPLIERFAILGHGQYLLDCDACDPAEEV